MSYKEFKEAIEDNRKNNRNSFLVHSLEIIRTEIEKNVEKVNNDLNIHPKEFVTKVYSAGGFQEVGLESAGKKIAFSSNGHDEISVVKYDLEGSEELGSLTYDGDRGLQNSVTNESFNPESDVLYFLSKI